MLLRETRERLRRVPRDIDVTFLDFLTCHAMSSKDLRQMRLEMSFDLFFEKNRKMSEKNV